MPKKKLIHEGAGYHITKKGYPRFNNCGKFKGEYIHRHEAAKMLGRPLKKDEDVHHRNRNKRDWSWSNLQVLGHREHGCVSSLQRWWCKANDIKLEEEWSEYFDGEASGANGQELRGGEGSDKGHARGAAVGRI